VIFDQIVRNPLLAERGEKGARSPPSSSQRLYLQIRAGPRPRFLPEEADRLLKNRFAEINSARDSRPDRKFASRAVRRRSLGTEISWRLI